MVPTRGPARLPRRQTNLGLLYENGWGVLQDDEQAYLWYTRAAHQGDVEAQTSVALMLAKGLGTRRNSGAALRWFQRAARQGHVAAWAHIGHLYRAGEGVPRDYVSSYAWYGIAAAGGHPEGWSCATAWVDFSPSPSSSRREPWPARSTNCTERRCARPKVELLAL